MNVAFLGLGGNMGNRLDNLKKTLALIESQCGEISRRSNVYETEAWGSDSQNRFLNQVVELKTEMDAEALLKKLSTIETMLGRKRKVTQNADRTVDVDILLFNNEIVNLAHIQIPHPRMHLRKFVLIPLCEISGDVVHPILMQNMEELLKNCDDELGVTLFNK